MRHYSQREKNKEKLKRREDKSGNKTRLHPVKAGDAQMKALFLYLKSSQDRIEKNMQ